MSLFELMYTHTDTAWQKEKLHVLCFLNAFWLSASMWPPTWEHTYHTLIQSYQKNKREWHDKMFQAFSHIPTTRFQASASVMEEELLWCEHDTRIFSEMWSCCLPRLVSHGYQQLSPGLLTSSWLSWRCQPLVSVHACLPSFLSLSLSLSLSIASIMVNEKQ